MSRQFATNLAQAVSCQNSVGVVEVGFGGLVCQFERALGKQKTLCNAKITRWLCLSCPRRCVQPCKLKGIGGGFVTTNVFLASGSLSSGCSVT